MRDALIGREEPAFLEGIPEGHPLPTHLTLALASPEQVLSTREWIAQLDAQLVRPQPPLAAGEPFEY